MKRVRISTVFVAMAALALLGALVLSRIDQSAGRVTLDSPAAVLFFALYTVFTVIGLVSSVILLFRDRSAIRWVECGLAATLLFLLSRVH